MNFNSFLEEGKKNGNLRIVSFPYSSAFQPEHSYFNGRVTVAIYISGDTIFFTKAVHTGFCRETFEPTQFNRELGKRIAYGRMFHFLNNLNSTRRYIDIHTEIVNRNDLTFPSLMTFLSQTEDTKEAADDIIKAIDHMYSQIQKIKEENEIRNENSQTIIQ